MCFQEQKASKLARLFNNLPDSDHDTQKIKGKNDDPYK